MTVVGAEMAAKEAGIRVGKPGAKEKETNELVPGRSEFPLRQSACTR